MDTPPPTLEDIGRRAHHRRLALDLTQDEVAARSGLSSGYISRLENGKSGLKVADLVSLSVALRMPAGELLMGTETRSLIEQVGQIAAPDDVLQIFTRIAGSLHALADEDRADVLQGLALVANVVERMARG